MTFSPLMGKEETIENTNFTYTLRATVLWMRVEVHIDAFHQFNTEEIVFERGKPTEKQAEKGKDKKTDREG